ncbi:MAG: NAD(P)H-hydrate dehydratase [Dehalococcoidia bacterium]
MKLVTVEQMRALEAQAIAEGTDIDNLMDAAGLAAAQETWMAMRIIEDRLVLVLAGPGNNGSDGVIAAYHLRDMGARVHVYLLEARAEDDTAWQVLHDHDIPFTLATDDTDYVQLESLLTDAAAVLDALLGTGSNRPIEGRMADVLDRLATVRESGKRMELVALDVPTGVDADSGRVDPHTVAADVTVGFGYLKVGLFQAPGRRYAGQIVRADIGLPAEPAIELPYEEIEYRMAQRGVPERPADGHKGTFGRAVVAAGSSRFPGAAVLAAEACARSGAGLTVIAAPEVIQPLLTRLPDAVHEPLPSAGGTVNGEAARALLRALPGTDALLVGPGLGHTNDTEAFMRGLLAGLDGIEGLRAVVLDADALNAVAGQPWHEWFRTPRIVTPHPGEMARLLGTTTEGVQNDRLLHATQYAAAIGGVVVLKGACTIIATADGRARISGAMNSMLATGGTGDVLAGLIAGFMAQGCDLLEAATAAVYVHSETASMVAKEYGEAAGLAQDLLRALPDARKNLDGRSTSGSSMGGGMGALSGMGGMGGMGGLGDMGGGFPGMPGMS